jgi:hypothetical protein
VACVDFAGKMSAQALRGAHLRHHHVIEEESTTSALSRAAISGGAIAVRRCNLGATESVSPRHGLGTAPGR